MKWTALWTGRASRVALGVTAWVLALAVLGACGLLDGADVMTSPIALPPSCEEAESCHCGGPGCHCEDGDCLCGRNGCYSGSYVSGAYCEDDGCFCHDRVCGCAIDGDCEVKSGDSTRSCKGEGCLCDEDQCMCEDPVAHPCECEPAIDAGDGCVPRPLFN